MLAVSIAGALVGLIMAMVALARIWVRGTLGVGTALTAFCICLAMLAGPLWHLPSLLFKPRINDIVTDPATPPAFVVLRGARPSGANAYDYPGADFARKQIKAYPDIRPMTLERSREETYDLVLANILARPLLRLAPGITRVAPGATLILAGILRHQARPVTTRYRNLGWHLRRRLDLGNWTILALRHRG